MGTIEDKLRHLLKTKTDLMYALRAKGVEIDENTPFSEYDVKIKNIQGGGDVILCKDMVELMDALPAAVGTLAIVYDPDIDIFLGIFEVKEDGTWDYVPTQLNAKAEHIAPGYRAYGAEGLVEGTFTSDATATINDMLNDKTAYVNGQRIQGNITPTYDATLPEQIARQVAYGVDLDDINLDYNIGVRCSSTSLCRVYRIKETSINTSYTSVSNSNYTSITFYTGTMQLSQKVTTISGVNYIRAYVAAKNSDNVVGIASFLINVDTLVCSNYIFKAVSGVSWNNAGKSNYTPKLLNVPHTNNKCMIAYYNISSADAWTHFQIQTFSTSSSSTKAVCWLGSNSSSTARGLNDTTMQFSDDGKLMVLCASMDRYGGETRSQFVATSANNWSTITTVYQSEVGIYANDTDNLYKLIDNNKVSNKNKIYNIADLSTSIGTLPYTPTYKSRSIQIGQYLYYKAESTSTTISIYKINDTSLTLIGTLTAQNGKWFEHYGTEILYVNSNTNITGYKIGEQGALVAMHRLGVDYYNAQDATALGGNILNGKIAYTTTGKTVGTMPNRGARILTPSTTNVAIPAGYHNGSGYVRGDTNLIPENIKNGVNIFNVTGTHEGGIIGASMGVFNGEYAILNKTIENTAFENFKISGKSWQDDVPSTSKRVNIQNINGNLIVQVSNGTDTQKVEFPLGSVLLSEGSYIDENGIHILDKQQILTGDESISNYRTDTSTGYASFTVVLSYTHIAEKSENNAAGKCNYLPNNACPWNNDGEGIWMPDQNSYAYFTVPISVLSNYSTASAQITSVKSWLKNLYNAGTPMIIQVRLAQEELVAFNTMQKEAWRNIKNLFAYKDVTGIATLDNLRIEGQSTQDEIPTSSTPQTIKNTTGDIVINVTEGLQDETITFPLGEQKVGLFDYINKNGIVTGGRDITFNGTENWTMYADEQSDVCGFYLPIEESFGSTTYGASQQKGICTHFPVFEEDLGAGGYLQINVEGITIQYGNPNGFFKIAILKTKATDVASLKTWLASQVTAGTPVTVRCPALSTSTTAFTEEQKEAWDKLQNAMSYGGKANIEIVTSVRPNLSGNYYIDTPSKLPLKIKNVNGTVQMDVKAKNKFNINNIIEGVYYEPNGANSYASSFSSIIELTPDLDYTISFRNNYIKEFRVSTMFYGKDMNFVSHLFWGDILTPGSYAHRTYTHDPLVKYLVVSVLDIAPNEPDFKSSIEIQVEEGPNATEYEPFVGIALANDQKGNISLTENQSIILTSDVEGEVVQATDLTVTPSTEEQVFNDLYSTVIVEAVNYEEAGTMTPEEYTEAQTQINDLFGEEVNE
jgi:hypothetical protein